MLERVLEAIREYGGGGVRVRDWSVFATERRRLGLGTKDRQTGNAHAPLSLSTACGARYLIVWDDGQVSRGYFERRQIENDVHDALAQARLAAYEDPDAAAVLGPAEMPRVRIHDPATSRIASGEVEALASRLEEVRSLVDRGGFRTWSGSVGASEAEVRLMTSAGLDVSDRGTGFGWHVNLNGELGDGFQSRAPEPEDEYRARLHRLAETVNLLGEPSDAMERGDRPVLLHPGVVESYVLGTLLENLQGSRIAHGEGYFRKEQFERSDRVFREDIRFRLDPLEPMKAGSYRFTSEGVPARPCTFIENGRLVRPVLNLKYARRLGLSPTPVTSGPDTMHLEGGSILTEEQAYGEAAGGALVLSVLGVHTQDAASGDFSLSAPQTLLIGPSGPRGRIRATLSGNLFDLLRTEDLRFVRFRAEHTPGMLVRCRLDPN